MQDLQQQNHVTDADLADLVVLDEPRLETRAAAPATGNPAAPAVHANDDIKALAATIDRQAEQLERLAKKATPSPVRRSLAERRRQLSQQLRNSVNKRDADARRGRPDPLNDETVRRTNAALDEAELGELAALRRENAELRKAARRPQGPTERRAGTGHSARSQAFAVYRKAALTYLRTGQDFFAGQSLRDLERRALNTEVSPDGGYLVHPEHDLGPIERVLAQLSAMRQVATVRQISAASLKKPFNVGGTAASWVGEQEARAETGTPSLVELEFPAMELYAKPLASQTMLEDSYLDIESWLADECGIAFAEAEELAFISGNAVKKPKGVLAYDKVANDSWAWDKLGYVVTGQSGAFPNAGAGVNQADPIMKLVYALRSGYRQGGAFMMNRATIGVVRTLKDANAQWVWRDSGEAGEPPALLGYPVAEAEQFPDMGGDTFSIAFGDWKRGYVIVDRVGMNVLRDPFSSKPNVEFYTRKRVGGGVQNFEAIKLLKFGTS